MSFDTAGITFQTSGGLDAFGGTVAFAFWDCFAIQRACPGGFSGTGSIFEVAPTFAGTDDAALPKSGATWHVPSSSPGCSFGKRTKENAATYTRIRSRANRTHPVSETLRTKSPWTIRVNV